MKKDILFTITIIIFAGFSASFLLFNNLNFRTFSYKAANKQAANKDINNVKWQIYEDERMGFQIKYPDSLKLISKNNSIKFHRDCSALKQDLTTQMRCQIEGDFGVSIISKTLDSFIEEFKGDCHDGHCFTYISKKEDYFIHDIKGKKLTGATAEGASVLDYIFVSKNNKNYLISYNHYVDEYIKMLASFKFIDSLYKNDKYNFIVKYDSYVKDSSLPAIIQDEDNVLQVLSPYRDKYQDGTECDYDYDGCVVINNKKYGKTSNKITVIDFIHDNNIERTVSAFLKKNGFDFKNCQIIIEDYEHGKMATLKLSYEMAVNKEDIKIWEEENGPADGAYTSRGLASVGKTKKYCSEFAESDMPETRYFIFKENRGDIFLFYEENWASGDGAFFQDSIKL